MTRSRHFRSTDGLTAGYGNMKILLQAAVILFLVFCARGVDAADGDSSSPLDKQAPILPHSLEVFEASYAYLKSIAGIALPDRQAVDDCRIAELEEHGFCGIIQDDYTNPVVAAMILGAFSIFYTRAGQDTEVEVSVEPQHVAAHQQYVAEMSGCMNKTMQMLREQGYGKGM